MPRLASSKIAAAFTTAGVLLAAVSCGSRTGLFGPDGTLANGRDAGPDAPAEVPCTPGRFGFELALTQLMFVLDRSGSMAFTLDGVANQARERWRWSILQDSLSKTITTFDEQIAMGATFFPAEIAENETQEGEPACRTDTAVAIPPGRGNATRILDVFDSTIPRGGTPTSEGVRIATEALIATRSVARTIVLATDGAPNCNGSLDKATCTCTAALGTEPCNARKNGRFSCLDDDRTIETIRKAAAQRIPVYVIGIGSTERPDFLQVLDDMAVAGGRPRATTPRHYNVQSEEQLTAALLDIRDSVAKCTYLTPSAPTDPNAISVEIDGVPILRDQSKTNGWDWIDQKFGALAFFGAACAKAQSASTPRAVSGVVTCGP